jgi:predicted HicB family RNase H-like nuclease
MSTTQKKITVNKFPLRLMPSVRKVAEDFSQKEGVSLNRHAFLFLIR